MDMFDVVPPDPTGLIRRTALRDAGYDEDEIDRLRRRGQLVTVRPGVYHRAESPARTRTAAHAMRCHAVAPHLASEAVFCGLSAAVLLGLPLWRVDLTRLHVVRDRPGGGRVRAGLHVHPAPVPEEDVIEIDGLRLTSPARTVADIARSEPAEQALIVADAALHRAVVRARTEIPDHAATTPAEVERVLGLLSGRRGGPRARRVLGLADELCESPGETRSRYRMRRAGLPVPVTQWQVPGTGYRVDFAWPDLGVVGEFDGRVKYGRALRPGDDVQEIVWREKRREDRIRATGLHMLRWIWFEIDDTGPEGLVPRLRAVLSR